MKRFSFFAAIVLLLSLSSCMRAVCPTFDSQSGEQNYKGKSKPKSNTSTGLFPKNM